MRETLNSGFCILCKLCSPSSYLKDVGIEAYQNIVLWCVTNAARIQWVSCGLMKSSSPVVI
jgi:hypothetical protein